MEQPCYNSSQTASDLKIIEVGYLSNGCSSKIGCYCLYNIAVLRYYIILNIRCYNVQCMHGYFVCRFFKAGSTAIAILPTIPPPQPRMAGHQSEIRWYCFNCASHYSYIWCCITKGIINVLKILRYFLYDKR